MLVLIYFEQRTLHVYFQVPRKIKVLTDEPLGKIFCIVFPIMISYAC
jgi:hypothetical protein